MVSRDFSVLIQAIAERESQVKTYLFDKQALNIDYPHLQDAVYSYVRAGGKSLRPAVLMFAAGAVGGDEQRAIPAAATVELYHTFTLVHDDIIDRDEMRRGVPTVHVDFERRARAELGYDDEAAAHYGLALAILAGDMQQGWAASILPALHTEFGVSAQLALHLQTELFRRVQRILINGETLDILLARTPIEQVTDQGILDMLWQKTGILYEFCGRAGAAIGLDEPDLHHPTVEAVAAFTGKCGTAFQIQDDVLGVVGKSEKTGKPVGSDIREGKRTLILTGSLPNLNAAERDFLLGVLGSASATSDDLSEAADLMRKGGGIDYAKRLARTYVQEALDSIAPLPSSHYKDLLEAWAGFIIERDL